MWFKEKSYLKIFDIWIRSWKKKMNHIMFNFIYFLKFSMFLFFKIVKTTFTYSLKSVFYFTLFLKTISKRE